MKYDEFAFFNQQLAAMLRDGIPLEGALKRLCEDMRRGKLRGELEALEEDLAHGTPITDALKPRQLPELYKRMVLVGVKSGDLPGALTMLADYFQRQNNLWTRLKGLMVYPLIVLFVAFVLSCLISYLLGHFIWNNFESLTGQAVKPVIASGLWMAPVIIALVLVAVLAAVGVSPARRKLRWRLPPFREGSLAEVASAMSLLLKNGAPLGDALGFAERLERGTCAGAEMARWRQRLASGHGKFPEMALADDGRPGGAFPALFVWTVAQSGENLAAGFERAAEIYRARAAYQTEMFLYSALPCAVLALAVMIVSQLQPVFATLLSFINNLSGG